MNKSRLSLDEARFPFISKLNKFLLCGLLLNSLAYLLFSFLLIFDLIKSPNLAYVFSATAMFPFSFYVNRKWVFQSDNIVKFEIFRFSLSYMGAIAVGYVSLLLFLEIAANPYLAQFLSISTIASVSFLVQNYWTFNRR